MVQVLSKKAKWSHQRLFAFVYTREQKLPFRRSIDDLGFTLGQGISVIIYCCQCGLLLLWHAKHHNSEGVDYKCISLRNRGSQRRDRLQTQVKKSKTPRLRTIGVVTVKNSANITMRHGSGAAQNSAEVT